MRIEKENLGTFLKCIIFCTFSLLILMDYYYLVWVRSAMGSGAGDWRGERRLSATCQQLQCRLSARRLHETVAPRLGGHRRPDLHGEAAVVPGPHVRTANAFNRGTIHFRNQFS